MDNKTGTLVVSKIDRYEFPSGVSIDINIELFKSSFLNYLEKITVAEDFDAFSVESLEYLFYSSKASISDKTINIVSYTSSILQNISMYNMLLETIRKRVNYFIESKKIFWFSIQGMYGMNMDHANLTLNPKGINSFYKQKQEAVEKCGDNSAFYLMPSTQLPYDPSSLFKFCDMFDRKLTDSLYSAYLKDIVDFIMSGHQLYRFCLFRKTKSQGNSDILFNGYTNSTAKLVKEMIRCGIDKKYIKKFKDYCKENYFLINAQKITAHSNGKMLYFTSKKYVKEGIDDFLSNDSFDILFYNKSIVVNKKNEKCFFADDFQISNYAGYEDDPGFVKLSELFKKIGYDYSAEDITNAMRRKVSKVLDMYENNDFAGITQLYKDERTSCPNARTTWLTVYLYSIMDMQNDIFNFTKDANASSCVDLLFFVKTVSNVFDYDKALKVYRMLLRNISSSIFNNIDEIKKDDDRSLYFTIYVPSFSSENARICPISKKFNISWERDFIDFFKETITDLKALNFPEDKDYLNMIECYFALN
jgi:hypothetical protein